VLHKAEQHSSKKVPGGTLAGKMCKAECEFWNILNETMVEVGETEEGLNILDFPGSGQLLR